MAKVIDFRPSDHSHCCTPEGALLHYALRSHAEAQLNVSVPDSFADVIES